jgi:hypothetical protein
LIAALKLENANHPLASREAVEAAVEDARVRALLNPDVIKLTYKDGKWSIQHFKNWLNA